HTFDSAHDEHGAYGGNEPDAPCYWRASVDIARNWERAQADAHTPHTRRVVLRTSLVMNPDRGSVFHLLSLLTRLGLGGAIAGGRQYVSWIHELDFVRAVEHLIENDALIGPVNLASPNPLPQRDFQRDLRAAWRMPLGLPAARWMVTLGAWALRSDPELLLKSRRVVSTVLPDSGFEFRYPHWNKAAAELVARARAG
ncbi:MAG: DUF1731 domain-containing protein, partial [Myxococcota bacterium]